jgi:hypothetical protein
VNIFKQLRLERELANIEANRPVTITEKYREWHSAIAAMRRDVQKGKIIKLKDYIPVN